MISSNANEVSKPNKRRPFHLKYRLQILYRFVLAIFGGYALSVLTAIVISLGFPSLQASAVTSGTMLAFIIHCAVFIWVFMVNSVIKASLGVIIPIVIFSIFYQLVKG